MKLKLNPPQQIALILGLLSLGAIMAGKFQIQILIHLAATLGSGLILFFIFKLISRQNKNIWNTIISCLIIFLVLHPGNWESTAGYVFATPALIATFITVSSKFFLEYKGSPIINPAILGLLVLTILAKIFPGNINFFTSWWGASFKIQEIPLSLIIIAAWIIFGLKTWRKFPVFFTYLITYAVLILIFLIKAPAESSGLDFLKFTFTDSTIYFLTSIMLVEPRTSPVLKSQQIIYGIIAAIFSTLYVLFGMEILMLLAIIVPNLYFFFTKIINTQQNRTA